MLTLRQVLAINLIAFVATAILGLAYNGIVAMRNSEPVEVVVTCVGEDSCSVPVLPEGWHADYRHNEWHITEGK